MTLDPVAEAMRRIEAARAALMATGEVNARSELGGRQPERSDAYTQARNEIHAAGQARNRLLIELVGDAEVAPLELARRLGLEGREAAHVLETARRGSPRMREHVFGSPPDSESPSSPTAP